MKKLFFIFLLLMYASPAMAQEMPVRGFIWGLPKEVIKENERGTFVESSDDQQTDRAGDTLFFIDKIRGLYSSIGYEFQNNKLWRVRIFIEKKYFEPSDRLDDLLTIQADLNARFGIPVAQEMKWVDKREMNYPDSWGWAIFRSELFMTSIWRDEYTEVTAYLGAKEKYKPILSVTYEDLPTKLKQEQLKQDNLLKAP
jgi:hypothetical protein